MSLLLFLAIFSISCRNTQNSTPVHVEIANSEIKDSTAIPIFAKKISDAALSLTLDKVQYDPAYFSIKYPNGDVPADKGVCTDVVIRTYRKLGIDLQKQVHEDMQEHFTLYPKTWGLKKTDTNIDHRRVPNLMTFFSRLGKVKKNSENGQDYTPGDIVTWDLGGGLTHIGVVVNRQSADKKRYLIVHNIGRGQEVSDCLFSYKITGHYFYEGKK
jgi:uncharacterized protein